MAVNWFVVRGRKRYVESELWDQLEGPKPPNGFSCDGCTLSPDRVRGARVWIACVIHDWHYSPLSPTSFRLRKEVYFWKNIYTVARYDGHGRVAAAALATTYSAATMKVGKFFWKRG